MHAHMCVHLLPNYVLTLVYIICVSLLFSFFLFLCVHLLHNYVLTLVYIICVSLLFSFFIFVCVHLLPNYVLTLVYIICVSLLFSFFLFCVCIFCTVTLLNPCPHYMLAFCLFSFYC